mmetsp:Transcript_68920/g.109359  ORF Transcript_68920/g.109359 Transcript_68920/m.109359 type:complete len:189 (-) Transcript_68920:123-689(-)
MTTIENEDLSSSIASDYQASAALQFCGNLRETALNAAFHAIGIGEELAELEEALLTGQRESIVAEAGDVCWYFSQMLKENGIDMGELVGAGRANDKDSEMSNDANSVLDFRAVHVAWGKVLGKQKRLVLGKQIPREELVPVCAEALATLQAFLRSRHGISMKEVLIYNNKKLVDRVNRGVIIGDGDNR